MGSEDGRAHLGLVLLRPAKVVECVAGLPVQHREIEFGGRHLLERGYGPLHRREKTCNAGNERKRNYNVLRFHQCALWLIPDATMHTNLLKPRQTSRRN